MKLHLMSVQVVMSTLSLSIDIALQGTHKLLSKSKLPLVAMQTRCLSGSSCPGNACLITLMSMGIRRYCKAL